MRAALVQGHASYHDKQALHVLAFITLPVIAVGLTSVEPSQAGAAQPAQAVSLLRVVDDQEAVLETACRVWNGRPDGLPVSCRVRKLLSATN
jgi:hypothetical protein